jgi:hypothetical protein
MLIMWCLWPRSASPFLTANAAATDGVDERAPLLERRTERKGWLDWVDVDTVDLFADEWEEPEEERELPTGNASPKSWKARARKVYEWVA